MLATATTVGGCILTSDLDRFQAGDPDAGGSGGSGGAAGGSGVGGASGTGGIGGSGGEPSDGCDNPLNLCVQITGFSPHPFDYTQADLVADGFLRTRAVLDPFGTAPDVLFILPNAILQRDLDDSRALRLQLWSDKSGDRAFTQPPTNDMPDGDHVWDLPVPVGGNVNFAHDPNFNELTRPNELAGTFSFTLTGFNVHAGQLFELWVQDRNSGRTAGYYRIPALPMTDDNEFTLEIPGIIDDVGTKYLVQFYADFNNSGAYELRAGDPSGDHSWVLGDDTGEDTLTTATDDGLSITFTHVGNFDDLTIGTNLSL